MTCAQGLLRLLWGGGPKLECYGTACLYVYLHDLKSLAARILLSPGLAAARVIAN